MKQIPLSQGKFAIVDDEDFEMLSTHKWHAAKHKNKNVFYARTNIITPEGKKTTCSMHRIILMINTDTSVCDHKDGNGLNNCKSNLRTCNLFQNARNRCKHKNGISTFKGVYLDKRHGRYQSSIRVNGKNISQGYFKDQESAAIAYDNAAKKYFGDFARLNFP
jgi:hypothetical protein